MRPLTPGAWALGMILWSGSRRHCRVSVAAQIAAEHRRRVELVGVFVNPTLDQVARAADEIGLTIVQLHGDEGPSFCGEVARRTGLPGDQSGAHPQRRRHPGAGSVPHRLSPAGQLRRQPTWRDRRDVRLGDGALASSRRAGDPVRRAATQATSPRRSPSSIHMPSTWRAASRSRPAARTTTSCAHSRRPSRRPRRQLSRRRLYERHRAPVRALRRPIRPGDPDAGAGGARGRLGRRPGRSGVPGRA